MYLGIESTGPRLCSFWYSSYLDPASPGTRDPWTPPPTLCMGRPWAAGRFHGEESKGSRNGKGKKSIWGDGIPGPGSGEIFIVCLWEAVGSCRSGSNKAGPRSTRHCPLLYLNSLDPPPLRLGISDPPTPPSIYLAQMQPGWTESQGRDLGGQESEGRVGLGL